MKRKVRSRSEQSTRGASKAKVPRKSGPSIVEEYEYQRHRRSGWGQDQLPLAAAIGDREALARCAALACTILDSSKWKPEFVHLKEWLTYALSRIHSGESPDSAFGWTRTGSRHRRREFRTVQRQFLIGRDVDAILGQQPRVANEDAAAIVAKHYGVAVETAVDYHKAFKAAKGKNS